MRSRRRLYIDAQQQGILDHLSDKKEARLPPLLRALGELALSAPVAFEEKSAEVLRIVLKDVVQKDMRNQKVNQYAAVPSRRFMLMFRTRRTGMKKKIYLIWSEPSLRDCGYARIGSSAGRGTNRPSPSRLRCLKCFIIYF